MIAGAGLVLALVLLLALMDGWMGPRPRPRVTELSRFPGNDEARRRWDEWNRSLPFEQRYALPPPSAPRLKEDA